MNIDPDLIAKEEEARSAGAEAMRMKMVADNAVLETEWKCRVEVETQKLEELWKTHTADVNK